MNRVVLIFILLVCVCLACRRTEPDFSLTPTGHAENITQLKLQVATPFVNVDTASRLLINYRAYDGKAKVWFDFLDYLNGSPISVDLFIDGVHQPNKAFFQPTHPGVFTLQAKAGDLISEPLSVTARPAQTYDVIRLPLIFHFPTNADPTLMPLTILVQGVNKLFSNQVSTTDPNQANTYIEFYLADRDPGDNLLAQPGMNRLPFSDQPTDSASALKADSVLRQWCIRRYINVFVKLNWLRDTYPPGWSYVSTPGAYTSRPDKNLFQCDSYQNANSGPAIMIAWENYPDIIAHELGHYLGLPHTFASGCLSGVSRTILDTPMHTEEYPAKGQKQDCQGAPFVASNLMDYHVNRANFTQDQVRVMRSTLDHPTFLPLPLKRSAGRQTAGSPIKEVGCQLAF